MFTERVTIGFVNYNKLDIVEECIDSVLRQQGGPYRLIFVDNASTDGSRQLVKEKYPEDLEMVFLEENSGPNPARNIILNKADSEYVLFLDADVILQDDVITRLVTSLDEFQAAGVASPKIMDYHNREEVQFIGTHIHYIGAAIHPRENREDTFYVTSLGGACLLARRDAALDINGWNEDMFFGWTDGDFVYRLAIAGHRAICVASAKIYHPSQIRRFTKVFHQIRNRWHFILTNYSWNTLLVISPMLAVYEIFLIAFLLLKKQLRLYFLANCSVISNIPAIIKKRRIIQKSRKVKDGELLSTGCFTVRADMISKPWMSQVISLFNRGVDFYWTVVRGIC